MGNNHPSLRLKYSEIECQTKDGPHRNNPKDLIDRWRINQISKNVVSFPLYKYYNNNCEQSELLSEWDWGITSITFYIGPTNVVISPGMSAQICSDFPTRITGIKCYTRSQLSALLHIGTTTMKHNIKEQIISVDNQGEYNNDTFTWTSTPGMALCGIKYMTINPDAIQNPYVNYLPMLGIKFYQRSIDDNNLQFSSDWMGPVKAIYQQQQQQQQHKYLISRKILCKNGLVASINQGETSNLNILNSQLPYTYKSIITSLLCNNIYSIRKKMFETIDINSKMPIHMPIFYDPLVPWKPMKHMQVYHDWFVNKFAREVGGISSACIIPQEWAKLPDQIAIEYLLMNALIDNSGFDRNNSTTWSKTCFMSKTNPNRNRLLTSSMILGSEPLLSRRVLISKRKNVLARIKNIEERDIIQAYCADSSHIYNENSDNTHITNYEGEQINMKWFHGPLGMTVACFVILIFVIGIYCILSSSPSSPSSPSSSISSSSSSINK